MANGHFDAALAAKLEIRAGLNHQSVIAFAGAIGFVVLALVAKRLLPLPVSSVSRPVLAFLLREAPGVPTMGHLVMVFAYLSINLVITFTNMDHDNMPAHSNIASRTGWMASANFLLVIVLSLKNTPLGFLIGLSHERLNFFHRIAGFTTLVFVIIHGCAYTSYFASLGRLNRLTEHDEIFGTVAGFAFLMMAISGAIVRRWWYELFYSLHIMFWIVAVVMTGFHQPDLAKKVLYLTLVTAGIWVLDRIARYLRLAIHSRNNFAILEYLPNGATRVIINKTPIRAKSGQHCFLYIPGIKAFETHPFTLVDVEPVEFVISSYDGFTRALYNRAQELELAPIRVSVDGPYGTLPDMKRKDKIIFIAGGSGASFTVGAALNLLKQLGDDDKIIEFIWLFTAYNTGLWFVEKLKILHRDHRVNVQLYVTRKDLRNPFDPLYQAFVRTIMAAEAETVPTSPDSLTPSFAEHDKMAVPSVEEYDKILIRNKKPDVTAMIKKSIHETPSDKSVLVMTCGPERLMSEVRAATVACIKETDGPSVELHCEQFGF